jgi:hypothetical protein
MTKTFFVLLGVERSTLSCVWYDTGNPAQPLACMWIDRDLQIAADHVGSVDDGIVNREVTSVANAGGSSVGIECASGTRKRRYFRSARQFILHCDADRIPC